MARTLRAQLHNAYLVAALCGTVTMSDAYAIPFAADTTSRESKAVATPGAAPFYNHTYRALTRDSQDLTFQEYRYSSDDSSILTTPRFLAFSTLDQTVDDAFDSPRQCDNDQRHVYWIDTFNGIPVCVSYDKEGSVRGGADGDSTHPQVAGPAGDEGRYVVFQTAINTPTPIPVGIGTPAVEPTPYFEEQPNLWGEHIVPYGVQQIVVHDRKWEETWLSTSKCEEARGGADEDATLWQISEDAQNILFSSAASNQYDNLSPVCQDGGSPAIADAFIRNGADCNQNSRGECKTAVLFDEYDLHAGEKVINLLDNDVSNLSANKDNSVVVFDSLATAPIHFKPDTLGLYDVYFHKDNRFLRISGAASIPRCSPSGDLLPITATEDPANGNSRNPDVDAAGRFVAFESEATDLVINENVDEVPTFVCTDPNTGQRYFPHPLGFAYVDTNGFKQIYLYDHLNRKVELISRAHNSSEGANGDSGNPWISDDAHYIVYESSARNLLASQTTASKNIFMYDRVQNKTYLVTPGLGGNGLNRDAAITHVSPSGLVVAYQSKASDAVVVSAANGGAVDNSVQHVYLAQNSCPLDTDGDSVPDCLDLCPNDSKKTEPAVCGCGNLETDTDSDLTPNCNDTCPEDADKTSPGSCGCGEAETDDDGDGTPNCVDGCPGDNSKGSPGACGCGVADTDTDSDGSADCTDFCPTNPSKTAPGQCTCSDLKSNPGVCGCNVADTDANGNGSPDCIDPTADTQPDDPLVDVTRIRQGGRTVYQVLAKLQQFGNRITYQVTMKGKKTRFKRTINKSKNVVGFRVPADTYTLSYVVKLGDVTTKETSITFKVPGGRRVSAARQATSHEGR
jgi:hypothetical protein